MSASLLLVGCTHAGLKRSKDKAPWPPLSSHRIFVSAFEQGFQGLKRRSSLEASIKDKLEQALAGSAGAALSEEGDGEVTGKELAALWEAGPEGGLPRAYALPSPSESAQLLVWVRFVTKSGEYQSLADMGEVILVPGLGPHVQNGDEMRLLWAVVLPDGKIRLLGQLSNERVKDLNAFVADAGRRIRELSAPR